MVSPQLEVEAIRRVLGELPRLEDMAAQVPTPLFTSRRVPDAPSAQTSEGLT